MIEQSKTRRAQRKMNRWFKNFQYGLMATANNIEPLIKAFNKADIHRQILAVKMKYLKCPKENGGCGEQDKFKIAIDRLGKRIAVDCKCGYRFSLPIIPDEKEIKKYSGYLDETGDEAKR